tara:strand:+ start:522 stop:680 length:159 start_codon:yes stop_codon:yes gene_type:complete
MDVIYFILKWAAVIAVVNLFFWICFPKTMRELTHLENRWLDYKLKTWNKDGK